MHHKIIQTLASHFSMPYKEYLEASKTFLNHKAMALFHKANQLSLELHKHHNFMKRITQNTQQMIKNFPYSFSQTIQQTLPPPGQKQMEINQTPRNGP